jgi:hydroxymethylbilane synthase
VSDSHGLRIATRSSALALAQARLVAAALGGAEIVPVKTDDAAVGDKGRFVRGVEQAVLDGEADLAVHSAKDLPSERPDGLALVGVPAREDVRDALIGAADSVAALPAGARVGTASLRRRSQLLALRDDLEAAELRGNVDTRLAKLAAGDYDAIVLAAAGLARLGRGGEISFEFTLEQMTPAAGQGALAIEARADDDEAAAAAAAITDATALIELTAERAAVAALEADCDTPVGICARFEGDELAVRGFVGLADGGAWVRDRIAGDPAQPAALGEELVERMLAVGAGTILEQARLEAVQ